MIKKLNSIGRWIVSSGRFFMQRLPTFRSSSAPRRLGPAGEQAAARYLQRLGYRIVARGHRQRLGEIDLIALDGDCLVFVEVKTWSSGEDGDPSLAVDRRKQEKLSRAALVYLKRRGLLEQRCRFDVVSIVWPAGQRAQPTIRHFPSAFEAIGHGQFFR
ncbi:MAG: YraN family protein [Aureliella sp.]